MEFKQSLFLLLSLLVCVKTGAENVILPPVQSVSNNQIITQINGINTIHGSLHFAEKYILNSTLDNNDTKTYYSDGAYSMSAFITRINVNKLDSLIATSSDKKVTYLPKDIINETIDTEVFDGSTLSITYYGKDHVNVEYVCTGIIPLPGQRIARNKDSQYGKSWKCMVNTVCNSKTELIRRSVCRLIVGGTELGTGTLINNTDEDLRPYVLTSAHVFKGNPKSSVKALFGFEVEDCDRPSEPAQSETETITNLELLCFYPEYDIALFELNSIPSETVNPYWTGWDISGLIDDKEEYICIHHPYGDVKKVSVGTDLKLDDYSLTGAKTPEGYRFASNVHYNVQTWLTGTTQGGSSGSGLWNNDNKLMGVLTGGYGSCTELGRDYYWSLALAWDKKNGDYMSLHEVLDPSNTQTMQLSGRDLYSKESSKYEPIDGDKTVLVERDYGLTTIIADKISEIQIHSLDGRLLNHTRVDSLNSISVNTSAWSNKLILINVKFGNTNKETIKVMAK